MEHETHGVEGDYPDNEIIPPYTDLETTTQPPSSYSATLGATDKSLFELEDPDVLLDATKNYLQQSLQPTNSANMPGVMNADMVQCEGSTMLQTGWLTRLTTLTYKRCCSRYNVVALREGVGHHPAASGIIADFRVVYREAQGAQTSEDNAANTVPYRVMVFQKSVAVVARNQRASPSEQHLQIVLYHWKIPAGLCPSAARIFEYIELR